MVIAAEEFPPARRGFVIGVIQGCSSLGAIVCAGVVPLLLRTPYGWRTVYFVGIVPLVILAFARRGLKETQKFAARAGNAEARPLLHIFRTPYRKRMLQLALIWGVTYICTQNGVTFFKEYATAERGMTDDEVGASISIAALASMPLIFYAGKLLDQIGRRWGGAVIFGLGALGVVLSYSLHGFWPMTLALVFGIFGASAVMPVLNAYTTELFPTEVRGDAFAWSNNLLGRITYVLSPIAVGELAERYQWGPVIQATAVAPVVAIALIFWLLPETKNRDIDDTAALH
jgi:putative MFS transporter